MIRYAITNGGAPLDDIRRWLDAGIELIQIREKHLSIRDLTELTRAALALPNPHVSKILVNDRADVAIACGAAGVHLRDGSVSPRQLRAILPRHFFIAVSCHDMAGVEAADSADYIVVAPVFHPVSKDDARATIGLDGLKRFVKSTEVPVLALGGITEANAPYCIAAGAAGVAGISLFR